MFGGCLDSLYTRRLGSNQRAHLSLIEKTKAKSEPHNSTEAIIKLEAVITHFGVQAGEIRATYSGYCHIRLSVRTHFAQNPGRTVGACTINLSCSNSMQACEERPGEDCEQRQHSQKVPQYSPIKY